MFHVIPNFKDSVKKFIFRFFHKYILRLRYKIHVKGMEIFDQPKPFDPEAGWLILPAHPSHIDGTILATKLVEHGLYVNIWTSEVVKNFPYFHWCRERRDLVNFIWVPAADDDRSIQHLHRVHKLLGRTVDGLQKGENFIIFPSAHPKYFPKNLMKGKSAISSILKIYPQANIVFVRIKGLWGSRFSRASKREDKSKHPVSLGDHLSETINHFIKSLWKNGLFFMPKRHVELEFLLAPNDFPRKGTRIEINKYIENILNEGWGIEGEPIYRVSEYFWKNEYVENEWEEKRFIFNLDDVSEKVREHILDILYEKSSLKPHQMDFDMSLGRDLGLDSLDLQSLLAVLENQYGVKNIAPIDLTTVGHVIALAGRVPIKETRVKKKAYKVITQEAFLPKFWKKIKLFFSSWPGKMGIHR